MERIMIDMDDVICDVDFLSIINQFLKSNYKKEDLKSYYMQDLIPKERYSEWQEFFLTVNIYDTATFIPNAYEVMEKLSKKYELYIATAYIFKDNEHYSAYSLKNKFEWLYENIPFISPDNYIFTTNKEIINCDIKIDDRLLNLSGDARIKMLFTAHHNKAVTEKELRENGAIRVNGWREIEELLL